MLINYFELSESDLTSLVDQKNSDQMIEQLLLSNSVIAKYCDLQVSHLLERIIIIIDLLSNDKSQYFAQTCSINVND